MMLGVATTGAMTGQGWSEQTQSRAHLDLLHQKRPQPSDIYGSYTIGKR